MLVIGPVFRLNCLVTAGVSGEIAKNNGMCSLRFAQRESQNVVELRKVTGLDHAIGFVEDKEAQILKLCRQLVVLQRI